MMKVKGFEFFVFSLMYCTSPLIFLSRTSGQRSRYCAGKKKDGWSQFAIGKSGGR